MNGTTFSRNVALDDSETCETAFPGRGGGLLVFGLARLELTSLVFEENSATTGGGASVIGVYDGSPHSVGAEVTLRSSVFRRNKADFAGGALSCAGGASVALLGGSAVVNNSAVRGGGLAVGAAADCACELVADGLTCQGNTAVAAAAARMCHPKHPHASLVDYHSQRSDLPMDASSVGLQCFGVNCARRRLLHTPGEEDSASGVVAWQAGFKSVAGGTVGALSGAGVASPARAYS